MHQKRNFKHGIKGTTDLAQRKWTDVVHRIPKADSVEVRMCTTCTLPVSKCKGTCVYRGE